jgi:hypothetical protein
MDWTHAHIIKDHRMRALALLILLLLITVQFNCKENFTYPELSNVSEIAIMDGDDQVKRINDPMLISKVVEFINKRRESWNTPITGFPQTKVNLYLYRNGEFGGSFGVTETSFSMQRGGRWDSKPATEQEVQELLKLLGIDKALLKPR